MYVSNLSKTIPSSLNETFALFTDLPGSQDRIPSIQKVEILSDGPFGMGTRWRETRVILGKEATEEMWVTAFDSPHSYTVEAESHGTHYTTRFQFRRTGENATEVSMNFEARQITLVAKVLGLFMSPMLRKMVAKCLEEDLEALAEAARTEERHNP